MMSQIIELILKLLGPMLKLLSGLPVPPRIAGVISVLPPLIGAAQVGWKFILNSSQEHKKRRLREQVMHLNDFLKFIL